VEGVGTITDLERERAILALRERYGVGGRRCTPAITDRRLLSVVRHRRGEDVTALELPGPSHLGPMAFVGIPDAGRVAELIRDLRARNRQRP
jgi:hypothetical protein